MTPLLLAALLAAAPAPAPALTRGDTGTLAALQLGMTQKQLEAAGFKPGKIDGWFTLAPMDARVLNGKVVAVDYQLTPAQAETVARKRGPAIEDLAAALEKCGPVQVNLGATLIHCDGRLLVMQHLGGFQLRLDASSPPPAQYCDAYLTDKNADLAPGRNTCLGERVLTTAMKLDAVEKDASWGACETVPAGDGFTRRCRATHLVFGKDRALRRVEFHPGK